VDEFVECLLLLETVPIKKFRPKKTQLESHPAGFPFLYFFQLLIAACLEWLSNNKIPSDDKF
jgi:hypothetical protein